MFPNLVEMVLRVIMPFPTTYACESAFSTLVCIKTKLRNRLSVEHEMRCALSQTQPRIKELVACRQAHPSHCYDLYTSYSN